MMSPPLGGQQTTNGLLSWVTSLLVGLYVVLPAVLSHSKGAPSCTDFMPGHGVGSQSSGPPYSIAFSPQKFTGGDNVTVTIKGNPGEAFKGFAIAARKDGSSDNYGTFTPVADTQIISPCPIPSSALTHTSGSSKSSLSFNWTSPVDLSPGLYFIATFVKDFTTLWTNVKATITTGDKSTTPPPDTTTPQGDKSTKPPNTWKCSDKFECRVSWAVDKVSGTTTFEYRLAVTNDHAYIALGLSTDDDMGHDSVMECLHKKGVIKGQYSYNTGKHNSKVADLNLNSKSVVDGIMTCNFTRNNVINNPKIFTIGQEKWYLLIAVGPVKDGFQKKIHNYKTSTDGRIDMMNQQQIISEEDSDILAHLHGVFMILAWVFFASVGMFAARYSKTINKKLCKIMFWFQLHRIFMALVTLFTVVGFILIFIEKEGEYSELPTTTTRAHPPLGIIVTILVIINPILGYFRPAKDSPRRVIFNWLHRMVGAIAMIFADVTIFIGVLMHSKMESNDQMHKAFVIEMSLFLVYKFFAICTMEVMEYCGQGKISAYEMDTPGQNKPVDTEVKKDERVNGIMLLLHMAICLTFAIALIATLFM